MSVDETHPRIPVLDLRRFEASHPGGASDVDRAAFLNELRAAAHDVGFFYVTGHGVDAGLLRDVMDITAQFFSLPEADKRAIDMVNSPHFRGYNRVASELTRGQPDWREQIDIGAERQALPRDGGNPPWTRLRGPNQWPAALPELRPIITCWQSAAIQVLIRLVRAFALALGQPVDALEALYADEPHHLTKLIRYPGRDTRSDAPGAGASTSAGAEHASAEHGGAQGVGAHKDTDMITLLLQDHHGGLQVETPHGWVDVTPRPDTFVINIGEQLELATDGYLRATMHRVVSPPPGTQRLSAAFFLGARLDATIPVLTLPPAFASRARGPERDPRNPLIRQVGLNYLKGRLRSHPDVAQLHHPDLL
jgi:isopenicillin N synthase-like dioxygenase